MVSTTIGAAGTYPDIDTWESSTVDGDNATGTCLDSADLATAAIIENIANTGSWIYLLTANSSCEITSPTYANATSKARLSVASGTPLTISGTGFVCERIAVIDSAGANQAIRVNSATTLYRLIVLGGNFYTIYSSANVTASNLMLTGGFSAGTLTWYHDSGTITNHHCSLESRSSGAGFYNNGTGCVCNGSVVNGSTSNNFNSCTGNYNVAQAATAPGAQSLTSQTGVFTSLTAGSQDFRLTSSVTYAIVNRSGYPTETNTDIAGTSRPSTGADAGCWQNPAAPPSGPTGPDNTKVSRHGRGRTVPVPSAIGH